MYLKWSPNYFEIDLELLLQTKKSGATWAPSGGFG